MPGQTLMCVWQAVVARDGTVNGGAPASLVRAITKEFAQPPRLRFSESAFRTTFPSDPVDFETYSSFVRREVIVNTTPVQEAEAEIEKICWDKCRAHYKFGSKSYITTDDLFKLWQMFNRIAVPGSCPPVVSVTDMNWWANKIAVPMNRKWTELPASTQPLTFLDAHRTLNERVFSRDAVTDARQSIEQLHAWLVKEVSMTGWMYKRTRKQGNNWTTWQRRYFILTPGEVRYFSSARAQEKDKKGKVSITMHSRLEALQDYKSMGRKYGNRFRLSNIPIIELELSPVTQHEKNAWMSAIEEVIEACKNGTTPVQAVLNERLKRNKKEGSKESIDQAMSRLKSVRLSRVPTKILPQEDDSFFSPPPRKPVSPDDDKSPRRPPLASIPQASTEEAEEEEEEFDNDSYSLQKMKVKTVFDRIDKNGNGLLNEREFDEFIRVLVGKSSNAAGIPVSVAIFADIDEDGDTQITLDEFYSYFTKLVLEQSPATEAEARLKEEFLKADQEGNAAINFGDFSEFVWERRRSLRYQGLMTAFERMDRDVQSDHQFPQLREFVIGQCGPINESQMRSADFASRELGRQIRDIQGEEETYSAASDLTQRWFEFVKEKSLVATDPKRIAQNFTLIDVVCFTKDTGKEPKKLTVDAARWEAFPDPREPAELIFPADSSSNVPSIEASDDNLKYYGCRLADESQEQIATLYHHRIEDMTYTNQNVNSPSAVSGPGMEKSTKCRFLCPLSNESGHLVIARWEGDEESIEITAFSVPVNKSVYIPAGTMYSTDYLSGSWRMLVEEDNQTSYAFTKRQFTPDNDRDLENIIFTLSQ